MGTLYLGNEFTIQSSPLVFFPAFRFPPPPLRIYLFIPTDIQTARLQSGLPRRRLKF